MVTKDKVSLQIQQSNYLSRDLSWLQFNYRVLDQCNKASRPVLDRLKFLAISSSNLDEFFMIRVGSLYNYLDYNKERFDYSGLREEPFRVRLFEEVRALIQAQNSCFTGELMPQLAQSGIRIVTDLSKLEADEYYQIQEYFHNTIFPMLTPMVLDIYHPYPVIMNKFLVFGVVTQEQHNGKDGRRTSFIQIPQNLPRFFEIERDDEWVFVPIEEIVRANISLFFRNIPIQSVNLFRIIRNGDFDIEESEDMETSFIEEVKRKLKNRKSGRVVRVEIEPGYSEWLMSRLKLRWNIDHHNVFEVNGLIDYTSLWQIIGHQDLKHLKTSSRRPVPNLSLPVNIADNLFNRIKRNDILIHTPYNSVDPVLQMLETAAEDPNVLAIKITIYRLAKESRITNALKKAAERGKHVSVLFEIKARFDEENNIQEALKLQEAGAFVIFGMNSLKIHAKMMLIVRKEGNRVTRYVHLSSGNYNEETSRIYTDVHLLTCHPGYAQDVAEFFNSVTGCSRPDNYQTLITAPNGMRDELVRLIDRETANAQKGLPAGVIIKINSLQDKSVIDALYRASQAGVTVRLIIRGICCLRAGRPGLSDHIQVRSVVGDYLEHSRIWYFHNNGRPQVFIGSADAMVRSFDKRMEAVFLVADERCHKELVAVLDYYLRDNTNTYIMQEDGSYLKCEEEPQPFNVHEQLYLLREDELEQIAVSFGQRHFQWQVQEAPSS